MSSVLFSYIKGTWRWESNENWRQQVFNSIVFWIRVVMLKMSPFDFFSSKNPWFGGKMGPSNTSYFQILAIFHWTLIMGGRVKEKRFEDMLIFVWWYLTLWKNHIKLWKLTLTIPTPTKHLTAQVNGSFNYSCAGADGRALDQEGFGGWTQIEGDWCRFWSHRNQQCEVGFGKVVEWTLLSYVWMCRKARFSEMDWSL